jgi:hypothetical protein
LKNRYSCQMSTKLEFLRRTFEKSSSVRYHENLASGRWARRNWQTDITKLLATYRKFQTTLKCRSYEAPYHAVVSKPLPHVTCYLQIFSPAQYKIFKNALYSNLKDMAYR